MTIIILVKLVIPKTNDGKTVKAVISNRICKGKEYSVVSPLVETFKAGKPEDKVSAKAFADIPVIIKLAAENERILHKFLYLSIFLFLSFIKKNLLSGCGQIALRISITFFMSC